MNMQGSAGQKRVTTDYLRIFKVLVPPVPEQTKIAKIISTWDKAITTTERLLANSQQQKKALMQQLLTGERRFFGYDDWNERSLSSLGTSYTGLSGKKKDDFGQGKPYVPYINIFRNIKVDIEKLEFVRIGTKEKQNQIKWGDILFTASSETPNEVGMSSVVLDDLTETYLNSFCFGFRLNNYDHLLPIFAQFLLRSTIARRYISALAQGATRYNLSPTRLMTIKFNIPPVNEQQKIASILLCVSNEIAILKNQVNQLKQEKTYLMQKLLTGQRRVQV